MAMKRTERPESNPDPITGAPGAHPIGVGLGAAAGGIAAGAAAGTLAAGPIGTVVGTAIGAVVGGLAGKGAAESMNPTEGGAAANDEIDTRVGDSGGIRDSAVETVDGPSRNGGATIGTDDSVMDAPHAGHSIGSLAADPQEEDYFAKGAGSGSFTSAVRDAHMATAESIVEDAHWREFLKDSIDPTANSVTTDHLSDVRDALEQSVDVAAVDGVAEAAVRNFELNDSETTLAFRKAVRTRPMTALAVAGAFGFLFVKIAGSHAVKRLVRRM
jgi:hypothetical protein